MQLDLSNFTLYFSERSADFVRLQSGWRSRWTGRRYEEPLCFIWVN